MADEDQAPGPQASPTIPQDDALAPILQQVRSGIQANDDGSTWADGALAAVQQHANATAVVDANQAAGQQFTQSIGAVKDNLVGMVRDDPTSAPLALDLAPRLMAPLVHSTGMDDDTAEDVHGQLTSHIQTEIARAAVTRMADLHADSARALMGDVSDHLQDGDHAVLGNYIDTMQAARTADNAAGVQQGVADQQRASGVAAYKFGSSLLDPRTESVVFPRDYLQSLVRNQAIQPGDKQALFTAYSRLNSPGDVQQSDPYAVRQLLSDIANPDVPVAHGDIADHVGQDVKYADAVMLHGMNLQRTPDGMGAVQQLGGLLDQAKAVIAPGNDRAGNVAYSRFVNWLLPSYRRTGPAGLAPGSDNYLFNGMSLADFKPTHADTVAPVSANGEKPSLGEIFAGNSPELDEKMRRLEQLRNENTQPIAPASGQFFQRKLAEQTKNG